jgi:hypothetical protein
VELGHDLEKRKRSHGGKRMEQAYMLARRILYEAQGVARFRASMSSNWAITAARYKGLVDIIGRLVDFESYQTLNGLGTRNIQFPGSTPVFVSAINLQSALAPPPDLTLNCHSSVTLIPGCLRARV